MTQLLQSLIFFMWLNPFHINFPFLYPLKTSENVWFSGVLRGYRNETLAWNGLYRLPLIIKYENNTIKHYHDLKYDFRIWDSRVISGTLETEIYLLQILQFSKLVRWRVCGWWYCGTGLGSNVMKFSKNQT